MNGIRPMLAAPFEERRILAHLAEVGYLWQQPKIDGMRAVIDESCLPRTRSGKEHKNRYLRQWCQDHPSLRWFDGEVVSGHEYNEETFRQSMSGVRAEDGSPEFTFFCFDYLNVVAAGSPYDERRDFIMNLLESIGDEQKTGTYHAKLVLCPQVRVTTLDEIHEADAKYLAQGFEGSILRRNDRPYKHNRSTAIEGTLVKLKQFVTAEARITGYEPWYVNENEATQSPLGFTVRSAHQDNLRPLERIGAWLAELVTDPSVKFKIGVFRGLSHSDRDELWKIRDKVVQEAWICEFLHQGYGGGYDAPRLPVWIRWRSAQEF